MIHFNHSFFLLMRVFVQAWILYFSTLNTGSHACIDIVSHTQTPNTSPIELAAHIESCMVFVSHCMFFSSLSHLLRCWFRYSPLHDATRSETYHKIWHYFRAVFTIQNCHIFRWWFLYDLDMIFFYINVRWKFDADKWQRSIGEN